MRVDRVSLVLLSLSLAGVNRAAQAQGIMEMGGANAGSAAASNGVLNSGTSGALMSPFGAAVNSISGHGGGDSDNGSATPGAIGTASYAGFHYDPKMTAAKAGPYTNKLFALAQQKQKAGKFAEAELLYREAVVYRQKFWGAYDPAVPKLYELIGDMTMKRGFPDNAIKCYHVSLMVLIKRYGQGSFEQSQILSKIGQSYLDEKKYKEAANAFEQVYKLSERKLGPEDKHTTVAALKLAKTELEMPGSVADAVDLLRIYVEILDKGGPSTDPTLLAVLDEYTQALNKSGKPELASKSQVRADEVRAAIAAVKAAAKPVIKAASEATDKTTDKAAGTTSDTKLEIKDALPVKDAAVKNSSSAK